LAWTSYGGELLFCEATRMPGKGNVLLTGYLGDVMKESARIALSYLKSNHKNYDLEPKEFSTKDIHIHFPAGAVPKDGPSAGIALITALASLFMQARVKHDIAMTGEITLQGKVLPVGGLKEKMLAAKRAGIKELILPEENRESISDFEEEILAGMNIHFVSEISEVLDLVIMKTAKRAKR